ncbi:MAG: 4-hydroxybutyrate CoA-transferase [Deltaproteobacteria bacterium]|nr:4-hydroxybutyrate CoA-transferase [Deltaproteobacteria bacterium]
MTKGRRLPLADAAALVRPRDTLACGLVAGQPAGFLDALGARRDLEDVVLYTGLLLQPYALLQTPGVRIVSGFFGPIERMARAMGEHVTYIPRDFNGLERLAMDVAPRVMLAVTSPPDADGYLSFGVHAGATFRPFLAAARDPARLTIAEVNRRMPRVLGLPELGGNRVHVSEVDVLVEHDADIVTIADAPPSAADLAIAGQVCERIPPGAILQFGIGAIPNAIAGILAAGDRAGFGVHTEMISDGIMRLHQAGKITNRKPLYDGVTVATFALGSRALYDWLDGNPDVRILPVTAVNGPGVLAELPELTSVNGAIAVDLAGQVAADTIGDRQYSGTGGHEAFVSGAGSAPGGRSFLCTRSTATVNGASISTIVAAFPPGTRVTTPRHHVQWVVTEHGAVDLSVLDDVERPRALVELADPRFRDALRATLR